MIVTFFLNVMYSVLDGLLSVLYNGVADVVANTHVVSAITSFAVWYKTLDTLLPLSHLTLIILEWSLVELSLFLYKGIRWAYQKIPGIT